MGASRASSVKPKNPMLTLMRMDKVVTEDYYHMAINNGIVHQMKLAHL